MSAHDISCDVNVTGTCSCWAGATTAELHDVIERQRAEIQQLKTGAASDRHDVLRLQKEFSVKVDDLRNEVIEEVARFLDEQAKLKGLKTSSKGRTTMGYARQVREMMR